MGYKWDRDTIAAHIRRRESKGRGLSSAEVKRENPHLYYAARYYFGTYGAAVQFALNAGVGVVQSNEYDAEWTRERVEAEIRDGYTAGADLSYTAVRGKRLLRHAKRLFGSWQAAVESAGINYIEVRRYGWGVVRSLRSG